MNEQSQLGCSDVPISISWSLCLHLEPWVSAIDEPSMKAASPLEHIWFSCLMLNLESQSARQTAKNRALL
jgi:hypothetical protein